MAKTILIVDDSNTARASVEYTLKKGSYSVVSADDGTTGLEVLGKTPNVDMIITDLNMPKMDGIEFIKHVRQVDQHKYTPILMLTTESQDEKKMEGKAAGASGWLVKPFNPTQLLDVVKRFLN
ncbi:response regulator [uncultured Brachyspira sp.]|uniref:response regulator n=1 Tax=uncultured Brachyspira sp. TaxID=221953 RepID=UPI00261AD1CE|nr:response regulator [uncultured Brachyspira sp.]